jgi:hypothetical protein
VGCTSYARNFKASSILGGEGEFMTPVLSPLERVLQRRIVSIVRGYGTGNGLARQDAGKIN